MLYDASDIIQKEEKKKNVKIEQMAAINLTILFAGMKVISLLYQVYSCG